MIQVISIITSFLDSWNCTAFVLGNLFVLKQNNISREKLLNANIKEVTP